MVMGRDSRSKVHGFESWHGILDGYFFTYICCKNCNICLKRPKISKKEAGLTHFKKVIKLMLHQYLAVIYSSSSIIVSDNENFTTLILRKRKTLKGEGTDVNLSVKEKHLKRKSSKEIVARFLCFAHC